MLTPFDTNLMTHTAEKHRSLTEAEREARAEKKRRNRAAFRAFVASVFEFAPRHGAVLTQKSVLPR